MRGVSRGVRKSGRMRKKFLWKQNPKRGVLLWDALDINNFYFVFFHFSILLFFFFFFFLKSDEEAHDNEVT